MKECDICGHAAERGSICHHCRAAIKRARDQTVSQFQGLPALALAGADSGKKAQAGRVAKVRPVRGVRYARKTTDRDLPTRGSGSGLLEVPAATHSAPFVWVILTLMVFVVTYVAYRVITTAIETPPPEGTVASGAAPAMPASSISAREGVPALAAAVLPPPLVEQDVQARPNDTVSKEAPEPTPKPKFEAPRAGQPQMAVREPRAAPPVKEMPQRPNEPVGPARAVQNVATTDSSPVPELNPAKVAVTAIAPPPARTREPSRSDHWQRMATAIRGCGGSDFLGRLLCEQKVRIQYCEGWWGQAAECPNGLATDHGQ